MDPSTLDHPDEPSAPPGPSVAYLAWVFEPSYPVGHRFSVLRRSQPNVFGRIPPPASTPDGQLDDEAASRHHFCIEAKGYGWVIEDTKSRNGTFLDGSRLLPSQPALLRNGQLIRAGRCLAIFREGSPPVLSVGPSILGPSSAAEFQRRVWHHASLRSEPVLICGDQGTGRDRMARLIHQAWSETEGSFVHIRCRSQASAVVSSIVQLNASTPNAPAAPESQSAAVNPSQARSVVYLDHFDELSPELVESVTTAICAPNLSPSLRIIASAHEDFARRSPLADRWLTLHPLVELVSLDERREDIPFLARSMAEMETDREAMFSCSALEALMLADYPANLWTLQAHVQFATSRRDEGSMHLMHLPQVVQETRQRSRAAMPVYYATRLGEAYHHPDAATIRAVLEEFEGNVRQAADHLRVGRRTLYRLMDRAGIQANQFRPRSRPQVAAESSGGHSL